MFAAIGLLLASGHFALEWTRVAVPFVGAPIPTPPRLWVPSAVFAFTGFLLVALGLRAGRRAGV